MPSTNFGEFELIARLTAQLPHADAVIHGVGDDAAVLDWLSGSQLAVTCDAQVERRHFLRDHATAEQIGRRALAVNLSDLAAMGAEPLFALVSLILPSDITADWLDELYCGLRVEAAEFDVSIVGGNIASTDGPLIVDITLLGRVARGKAVLRSGARAGDRVCVTGMLGSAAAGLISFLEPVEPGLSVIDPAIQQARESHRVPQPRVAQGSALAKSGLATAMIDISDGLAADLGHLCEQSAVGAVVEMAALPIASSTARIAAAYGRDPVELALFGGEDYELLFTVPPDKIEQALATVRAAGGTVHTIGWIIANDGEASPNMRLRLPDGSERSLPPRGWDHLRDTQT